MRLHSRRTRVAFNHQPFSGQGVSLYVGNLYRNLHLLNSAGARPLLVQGTDFPIGETNVSKTARIASTSGTAGAEVTLSPDLSAYNESTIQLDLRHYKDHVESEVVHPRKITIDASGDAENKIQGAYQAAGVQLRAGGVVRVRFWYLASSNGVAPETFSLSRTAGPTTPGDVSVNYEGSGLYEIDTAALSDASAYTFDVIASNATLSVTRTLGAVTFTADASGPAAPTTATAEAF